MPLRAVRFTGYIIRYALCDLRQRSVTTLLAIFAVAMTVISTHLPGYYAFWAYQHQAEQVQSLQLNRIEVAIGGRMPPGATLTPEWQAQLAGEPGVTRVSPRIELGARLWLGDKPAEVTVEGLAEGDALLDASRLTQGRGPHANQQEAVIPASLYRKLGGTVSGNQLSQTQLELEIGRTVQGAAQTQRLSFAIAGLLAAGEEKVYLSLATAERLDLWCTGKTDVFGNETRPVFRPAALTGFVPQSELAELERQASEWQIGVSTVRPITAIECTTPIWCQLDSASEVNSPDALLSNWSRIDGVQVLSQWSATFASHGRPVRALVLSADDPRWQELPQPVIGEVLTSDEAFRGSLSTANGVALRVQPDSRIRQWSGNARFVTTTDTLQFAEISLAPVRGIDLWCTGETNFEYLVRRIAIDRTDVITMPGIDRDSEHPPLWTLMWPASSWTESWDVLPPNSCLALKLGALSATLGPIHTVFCDPTLPETQQWELHAGGVAHTESRAAFDGIAIRPHPDLPRGYAFAGQATFRRLAFELRRRPQFRPDLRMSHAVRVDESWRLPALADHAASCGLELRPLQAISRQIVHEVRIQDPQSSERISPELHALLSQAKPTIEQLYPEICVTARIGTLPISLVGVADQDPRRFAIPLAAGTWCTSGKKIIPVVLPKAAVPEGLPAIGRSVELVLRRTHQAFAADPGLEVTARIVGIAADTNGFIPLSDAEHLRLWQMNELVYNATRGTFESPVEIHQRNGHVRCTIDAASTADVERIVARLERDGFDVRHSLGALAGLRELAWNLTCLVAGMEATCVLLAVLVNFVIAWMAVQSKTYEIGILKSYGSGAGLILGVFAFEALVIGTVAFLLAESIVIVGEPGLRTWITTAMQLPLDKIICGHVLAPNVRWLVCGTFALAECLTLFGTLCPAIQASRLAPVEALRRRE